MGREIRLIRALADEGYQYGLNDGVPPIPRDQMVTFTPLPRHLALEFMHEIEKGGDPGRACSAASGQLNPDGVRDYDLLVPGHGRGAGRRAPRGDARDAYQREADAWRDEFIAEHGGPIRRRPAHP